MNSYLLQIAFAQTWQIAALVAVVALITRLVGKKRAHFAYLLWLLVLLKCLTPPVISNSAGVFCLVQETVDKLVGIDAALNSDDAPAERTLLSPTNPATRIDGKDAMHATAGVVMVADSEQHSTPRLMSGALNAGADGFSRGHQFKRTRAQAASWVIRGIAGLLIVSLAVFLVAVFRVVRCVRRAIRDRVAPPPPLVEAVERLSRQAGLRRAPRLIVTRQHTGPAVLGVFRPALLLPECVVKAATPDQLQPILMHELLHIRRGDLRVGLLQTLTLSLWWFHPCVWIASRFLTRESERCCDEETIAELGCAPKDYARALLRVLEAKHILKPVPVVPGIRPVDLTTQRIGRIMRLKHECRNRTPLWCWLTLLIAAVIVLPGAALVADDEKVLKQKPPVTTIVDSASASPDRSTAAVSTATPLPESRDQIPPVPAESVHGEPPGIQPSRATIPSEVIRVTAIQNGGQPRVLLASGDTVVTAQSFAISQPIPNPASETHDLTQLIDRYGALLELLNQIRQQRRDAVALSDLDVTTRIYPIADLIVSATPSETPEPSIDHGSVEAIVGLLRTSIDDDSWDTNSVSFHEDNLALVIRQTGKNHREIAAVLDQARSFDAAQLVFEIHLLQLDNERGDAATAILQQAPRLKNTSVCGVINAAECLGICEAVQSASGAQFLVRPKMCLLDGQTGSIEARRDDSEINLKLRGEVSPRGTLVRVQYGLSLNGTEPPLSVPRLVEEGNTLVTRMQDDGEQTVLLMITPRIMSEEPVAEADDSNLQESKSR